MNGTLWHLGKLLQVLGLLLGPWALFVGIKTNDAREELSLLLFAVILFLVGLLLVRSTGAEK